jgi:hypothetical protein
MGAPAGNVITPGDLLDDVLALLAPTPAHGIRILHDLDVEVKRGLLLGRSGVFLAGYAYFIFVRPYGGWYGLATLLRNYLHARRTCMRYRGEYGSRYKR